MVTAKKYVSRIEKSILNITNGSSSDLFFESMNSERIFEQEGNVLYPTFKYLNIMFLDGGEYGKKILKRITDSKKIPTSLNEIDKSNICHETHKAVNAFYVVYDKYVNGNIEKYKTK